MAVVFLDPQIGTNDGFDVEAQYQMVPAGGARRMAFWAMDDEPEDVIIYITDPNKAYVYGLYVLRGHANVQGSGYFVKRGAAIRFVIGGRDPGVTSMTVETVSGKTRGFLLLSIKPPLRLTYQLAVLSDPIHVPAKELVGRNLAANMAGAAKLWLEQANITLEQIGPINDVVAPIDLGDPLVLDDAKTVLAIVQASHTKQLVTANLYIFCTWNIVFGGNPGVAGFNLFNMCFVENQFIGRAGALISAHEVGHGLGLPHSNGGRIDLLMQASAINNDFIDMRDIEWSNQLPVPTQVAPWLYAPGLPPLLVPIPQAAPKGAPGIVNAPSQKSGKSAGLLKSNLFAGDARLERCATSNPDHVTRGAVGSHVRKIQSALVAVGDAAIDQAELDAGRYGPSTAQAVLAYKTERDIVNRSYETAADDIVGIMTIKALDAELLANQVEEKPTFVCRCPRHYDLAPEGGKTRLMQELECTAAKTHRSGRPAAVALQQRAMRTLGNVG
jgi:hypothetical protein